MRERELQAVQRQLLKFVQEFKPLFRDVRREHWCGAYLSGLMLDGERKSIEPMASRLSGGNEQALQQFVNQSRWKYAPVQDLLMELMLKRVVCESPAVLVIDDTSLPKKGEYSVGVSHQYCGALGKQANCQIVVSWHYANSKLHFPLNAELYLPKSWTSEPERMKKACVPADRFEFKEKWRLALELLDKITDRVDHEAIICDAGYGQVKEFLRELDERDEHFIAQIPGNTSFWPANIELLLPGQRPNGPRKYPNVKDPTAHQIRAQDWAKELAGKKRLWRRVTLPHQKKKTIEITAVRAFEYHQDQARRVGLERWLLIERVGSDFKYYVSNLPKGTSLRHMILLAHSRWKIEQGYQQLKEELGLDHFEGRSWQGLHHHITLCFMAYCFLVLLQQQQVKKRPQADEPVATDAEHSSRQKVA